MFRIAILALALTSGAAHAQKFVGNDEQPVTGNFSQGEGNARSDGLESLGVAAVNDPDNSLETVIEEGGECNPGTTWVVEEVLCLNGHDDVVGF